MSKRDEPGYLLILILGAMGLAVAFALGSVLIIALSPVILGWGAYRLYAAYQNSETQRMKRAEQRSLAASADLREISSRILVPDAEAFAQQQLHSFLSELDGMRALHPPRSVREAFLRFARDTFDAEGFNGAPGAPWRGSTIDHARFQDAARERAEKLAQAAHLIPLLRDTIREVYINFYTRLPAAVLTDEPGTMRLPVIGLLSDVGDAVMMALLPLYQQPLRNEPLFTSIKAKLDANLKNTSAAVLPVARAKAGEEVPPDAHPGPPQAIVDGYLAGTPLSYLFESEVPFSIPLEKRFQHQWVLGGTGAGKTTLLNAQIIRDLDLVAHGRASVVLIDSQGSFMKSIARLRLFATGQPLDGKLVIIDAADTEFPIAANLFDMGMQRINAYSANERAQQINSILSLFNFVLNSLLGAELTSRQSTLFNFTMRLLFQIPGATIHTFRELMQPRGLEKYREHVAKLGTTAQDFFNTQFDGKQFAQTKEQVSARLFAILGNDAFDGMFSSPRSKIDMFAEMNAGKVIIINTSERVLQREGTEIFGRFFLAMIAQAAQEREAIPEHERMPTFVYIDECQDYLYQDENIEGILEKARKMKVGLIMAHHHMSQLSPSTIQTLTALTSSVYVGNASTNDLRPLAQLMRTTPEFLQNHHAPGLFAFFVRGLLPATSTQFAPIRMEYMNEASFLAIRSANRAKYAVNGEPEPRACSNGSSASSYDPTYDPSKFPDHAGIRVDLSSLSDVAPQPATPRQAPRVELRPEDVKGKRSKSPPKPYTIDTDGTVYYQLSIYASQARKGVHLPIKFEGKEVTVAVPAGIRTGDPIHVSGKGMRRGPVPANLHVLVTIIDQPTNDPTRPSVDY